MQADSFPSISLTKQHLQILQCIDTLFTRWSLRKNTYFFKHLKPNLQLPLFIIAEQRRISQITQSQSVIVQALKMSEFVDVNQQSRVVRFVQLNTVRVTDEANLIKVQKLLKQYLKEKSVQDKINAIKPPQYITSTKTDDGFYYLALKQKPPQNPNLLCTLIEQYNKSNPQSAIAFSIEPMYDDIKQSITKIRKSKQNEQQRYSKYNNNYNNYNNKSKGNYGYSNNTQNQLTMPVYSRQNMMMMYPGMYYQYGNMVAQHLQEYNQTNSKTYGVFIRKAVESQDEDVQQTKQQQNANINTNTNTNKKHQQKQQKIDNNQTTQQTKSVEQQKQSIQVKQTKNGPTKHQKKYESKQNNSNSNNGNSNNGNNKQNNRKNQSKNNKNTNKVVLDDNDFPTIG